MGFPRHIGKRVRCNFSPNKNCLTIARVLNMAGHQRSLALLGPIPEAQALVLFLYVSFCVCVCVKLLSFPYSRLLRTRVTRLVYTTFGHEKARSRNSFYFCIWKAPLTAASCSSLHLSQAQYGICTVGHDFLWANSLNTKSKIMTSGSE